MNNNWKVVFEDDDLVVVNKPPGLVVNRADSVKDITMQDLMEREHPTSFDMLDQSSEDKNFRQRSGMVHRLDKDTSGIIIWAKKTEVMMDLMRQFKERRVDKTYLTLVHGRMDPREGTINWPIGRSRKNRQKFEVQIDGKPASTGYEVLSYYKMKKDIEHTYQDGFSLMEMSPKTGRTHQIRVHLTHLKHPIVGDRLYGTKKRVKSDAKWCQRQFLHAHSLILMHPGTKKQLEFRADLSEDLQKVLSRLKKVS